MSKLAVGDTAPEFTLPAQDGRPVRLSDLLKNQTVVLYFYPKDETTVCTAEASGFRDAYEVFSDAGAEVVGVSDDSVASHRSFAAHHRLPFMLLSDQGGEVRKRYGVGALLGLINGRVTFVIDRSGVVRHAYSSRLEATGHVERALETIRGLGC